MNKWMKQGMIGLALSTATVGATTLSANTNTETVGAATKAEVMIDAMDYAGGSKLKDRTMAATVEQLQIVQAIALG